MHQKHTQITSNAFKIVAMVVLFFINIANIQAVFFNQYNFFHSSSPSEHSDKITVYASFSLEKALNPVIDHFAEDLNLDISVMYMSSPYAVFQLEQGAPIDLLLSSESKQLQRLATKGWVQPPIELWQNRLALVKAPPIQENSNQRFMRFFSHPEPNKVNDKLSSNDLFNIVDEESWENVLQLETMVGRKIGVADPITSGLGFFTEQVLAQLPFKEKIRSNTRYAYDSHILTQDLKSHRVDFGIVYYSDVISLFENGLVSLIPDSLHDPIIYSLASVNKPSTDFKKDKLQQLIEYLQSIPISMQMLESGLTLPSLESTSFLDDISPFSEDLTMPQVDMPFHTDIKGINNNQEDFFRLGLDDKPRDVNQVIESPLRPKFDIQSMPTDAEQTIAPLEEIK